MIFRLFRPVPQDGIIASLYGMIVAQARAPLFYRSYGVPDTVNGRFEMVTLHCVLLLRHLEKGPAPARDLGQQVFDRFCTDMDDSMREMGVGDLTVPRKMQRVGEAFYGRQRAYGAALASSGDELLATVLERNVFGGAPRACGAGRLAAYMRAADRMLGSQQGFMRGELFFPDPGRVAMGDR
jgi:cytochrome b pre-mRNA-processing protein 3